MSDEQIARIELEKKIIELEKRIATLEAHVSNLYEQLTVYDPNASQHS
jgi:uncharacterized coiled-coil protein SlyX